jgi:acyl carrier protein
MTASTLRDDVESYVRQKISLRTKVPGDEITPDTVLLNIGLQSIDAVLICGEVEDRFEVELDPTMMFKFRTLEELITEVLKVIESQK